MFAALASSLGAAVCGDFFGSPVYGCSTIGLAHSRNLLVSACARYLSQSQNFRRAGYCRMFPPPTPVVINRPQNLVWGCRFAGPAAPFTAVEPSGWPTVATCRSKPFQAVCAEHVCLKHVYVKHVTAIALSLAETLALMAALTKAPFTNSSA